MASNKKCKSKPWKTTSLKPVPNELVIWYDDENSSKCPYVAWKMYIPSEKYVKNSDIVRQLEYLHQYFSTDNVLPVNLENVIQSRFIFVDVDDMSKNQRLSTVWATFSQDLINNGERIIGMIGLSIHQIIRLKMFSGATETSISVDKDLLSSVTCYKSFNVCPIIRARIRNFGPIISLKHLKVNYFSKLVCVKGTVARVSNIKPICTWMAFRCRKCDTIQSVQQPAGQYMTPRRCPGQPKCTSGLFDPLRSHRQTITVDWKCIKLQEVVLQEAGRVPRTIECVLIEDLCDSCILGDVVSITGVVKTTARGILESLGSFKSSAFSFKDPSMFHLYIDAVSVDNNKTKTDRTSITGIEFTETDYEAIREIHSLGPSVFNLLVTSLCPSIYGHEIVKAGLLLGLFGGTSVTGEDDIGDGAKIDVRCDSHVLVVGDPGLGKSQMLSSCAMVAPRGVFVTGNTLTSTGLTVTLAKGAAGNDFTLEAGALVLADRGCCCIDEFDKMASQHHALLEAMEQQMVSIAKAGVVCSLAARTAVLAAANPIGGHYKRSKTMAENLKMGAALLSRFDLVFILIDEPNDELDCLMSDHIMNLHHRHDESVEKNNSGWKRGNSIEFDATVPLIKRLQVAGGSTCGSDPLPHQIMRKYIAYARRYVFPRISTEAAEILKEFYLQLRQRHHTYDGTPITTRQLESLIRLTEARAKIELREVATKRDAIDVVEIMKFSMIDTLLDEVGSLDFTRSQNGAGISSKSAAKKFIVALQGLATKQHRSIFSLDEMSQLATSLGSGHHFMGMVESLNEQGCLLKKSADKYKLLSYGC